MAKDLLSQLADIAREQNRSPCDDDRYEALAVGSLSDDQLEDLRSKADQDPLRSEAYELFRPVDDKCRQAIHEIALSEVHKASAASPSNVVPIRRRVHPAVVVVAAALALAAAWFVVQRSVLAPDLPSYAMTVEGGDTAVRSSASTEGVPRLAPGSMLEIVVAPATGTTTKVEAKAFLLRPSQTIALTAPVEVSAQGACRFAGTREQLFGSAPSGTWDLVVVVGPAGSVPTDAQKAMRDSSQLRVLRKPIFLQGP